MNYRQKDFKQNLLRQKQPQKTAETVAAQGPARCAVRAFPVEVTDISIELRKRHFFGRLRHPKKATPAPP